MVKEVLKLSFMMSDQILEEVCLYIVVSLVHRTSYSTLKKRRIARTSPTPSPLVLSVSYLRVGFNFSQRFDDCWRFEKTARVVYKCLTTRENSIGFFPGNDALCGGIAHEVHQNGPKWTKMVTISWQSKSVSSLSWVTYMIFFWIKWTLERG